MRWPYSCSMGKRRRSGWVLAINQDAAAEVGRVGEHPGNRRRQTPIEDPQADIPLESASEGDHGLVAEPKSLTFLERNGFRQFSRAHSWVQREFRWVVEA